MNNAFLQPQMPARQEVFPSPPAHEEVLGLNIQAPSKGPGIPGLALAAGALQSLGLQRECPTFVRPRIGSFF